MRVNTQSYSLFFYTTLFIISCFYLLLGQSQADSNSKAKPHIVQPSKHAAVLDKRIPTSGFGLLLKTFNSYPKQTYHHSKSKPKTQTWKTQIRNRKNYAEPSISTSHFRTAQHPYVPGSAPLPNYDEAANILGHRTTRDATVPRRPKREYDDGDAEGDYNYYENVSTDDDSGYDNTGDPYTLGGKRNSGGDARRAIAKYDAEMKEKEEKAKREEAERVKSQGSCHSLLCPLKTS